MHYKYMLHITALLYSMYGILYNGWALILSNTCTRHFPSLLQNANSILVYTCQENNTTQQNAKLTDSNSHAHSLHTFTTASKLLQEVIACSQIDFKMQLHRNPLNTSSRMAFHWQHTAVPGPCLKCATLNSLNCNFYIIYIQQVG
jgi:hypothetical protein